jgi:predicted protein tyrosine phosphatase
MNLLFVCSRNIWRSKTAETIFNTLPNHHVKSAGTSPSSRIKINFKQVEWADLIFVMEKKHAQIIKEKFSGYITNTQIIVLNIADEYQYMDEDLIDELEQKVSFYLE